MNFVKKLTNKSSNSIPVDVDQYTRLYVAPDGVVENKHVYNLDDIRQYCKIEEDLTEVNPIKEGRQYLRG